MRCCSRTKIPSVPSKLFVNKDKNELLGRFSGQHTFLSKADKKKNLLFTEKLVFNQPSYSYACPGYSVIVNATKKLDSVTNTLCWELKFRQICLGDKKVLLSEDTSSRLLPVYILLTKYGLAKNCVTDCVLYCDI